MIQSLQKRREDEPDYFPPSETLRYRFKTDAEQMNFADSTDVANYDGKPMNFTNGARTAASDEFQMKDQPQRYRLSDLNQPNQLTKLIRKVSLSKPVMNQDSPVEDVDLFDCQRLEVAKWFFDHSGLDFH